MTKMGHHGEPKNVKRTNESMSHCPLMHVQTMAATSPRHLCLTAWTWLKARDLATSIFVFKQLSTLWKAWRTESEGCAIDRGHCELSLEEWRR